jgi:hypothetical protein
VTRELPGRELAPEAVCDPLPPTRYPPFVSVQTLCPIVVSDPLHGVEGTTADGSVDHRGDVELDHERRT